ncbi:MAG TPA: hypothetical protein VGM64_13265 [Lacunisphaera sp.]|jgi:hypothetical protein
MQTSRNTLPIPVSYRDGKTESIVIRELEITELYEFIDYFVKNNSPRMVSFCAGKDQAWVDTLTDESFRVLIKEVLWRNYPRIESLVKVDVTVAVRLAPTIKQIMDAENLLSLEISKRESPISNELYGRAQKIPS